MFPFLPDHLSAYELIKVLNGLTGRNLPTQMGYNYVSKGMIPSVLVDGKKKVSREAAVTWMVKYVKRNVLVG
jgi:hypothetical protein